MIDINIKLVFISVALSVIMIGLGIVIQSGLEESSPQTKCDYMQMIATDEENSYILMACPHRAAHDIEENIK